MLSLNEIDIKHPKKDRKWSLMLGIKSKEFESEMIVKYHPVMGTSNVAGSWTEKWKFYNKKNSSFLQN